MNQSRLHELHEYDPETGLYISKRLKRPIGCKRPRGLVLQIDKKAYLVHRLIYIYVEGSIPENMVIDHINGDPFDNRWNNLRLCTQAENGCNRKLNARNTTGFTGVVPATYTDRFECSVFFQGHRYHLGTFDTVEEASEVYEAKATELFGEFKRDR